MGEAKAKRTQTQRLIAEQQFCTYCGGDTPGTTVDHMPPRTIFKLKLRPKGLEFLACDPCNSGSRPDEQVASLISRLFPDPETQEERDEVTRIFRAAVNNQPDKPRLR